MFIRCEYIWVRTSDNNYQKNKIKNRFDNLYHAHIWVRSIFRQLLSKYIIKIDMITYMVSISKIISFKSNILKFYVKLYKFKL